MSKISVIIPIYNRASLVLETLVSIENQFLMPEEVIIVDDGSTDNSVEVISEWKKKTKLNIHIFKNKNKKGQSGALNFGIAKARGEYIAMQDSDDLWDPCHLQQLMSILASSGYDIAFSKIQVFGIAKDVVQKNIDFSESVQQLLEVAFEKKTDLVWLSQEKLLYALLQWRFPFRCPASLIKKSFFYKSDLWFDDNITYCLDAQFMIEAAWHTGFIYIDNVGFYLRRHAENDGDLNYGDKIWKSYEYRTMKLKQYFCKKPLSRLEKLALDHRLIQLYRHILIAKTKKFGFLGLLQECIGLFKVIPSFATVVLILKTIVKHFLKTL